MKTRQEIFSNLRVSICHDPQASYPVEPPFSPHLRYPEYSFPHLSRNNNRIYGAIRSALLLLGLDRENFGTPQWNPFKEIIKPEDKVVIKPNFILHTHMEGGNLFSIITHASVLRAMVDYVYKSLQGIGQIIIADAPNMDCNFNDLINKTNLSSIQEIYWKNLRYEIKIIDLRDFWLDSSLDYAIASVKYRKKLKGDPLGNVVVNLEKKSAFYEVKNSYRFYGADYNRKETIKHHTGETQEYMISKTVLDADVIISVPKLKVHKKVGVTLNIKGLVGTCTNKNYLVHYTLGTPEVGGDQFPSGLLSIKENLLKKAQRFLYDLLLSHNSKTLENAYILIHKLYKKIPKPLVKDFPIEKAIFDGGNWHGNDSAWRMASDLMKIIMYSDRTGKIREDPQRLVFSLIDGVIGGENNGPLTPDEKQAGVLIAGFNPLTVDIVGTRLMGFQWHNLKWIMNLLDNRHFGFFINDPKDIEITSNNPKFCNIFHTDDSYLNFKPHQGWRGFLEIPR